MYGIEQEWTLTAGRRYYEKVHFVAIYVVEVYRWCALNHTDEHNASQHAHSITNPLLQTSQTHLSNKDTNPPSKHCLGSKLGKMGEWISAWAGDMRVCVWVHECA